MDNIQTVRDFYDQAVLHEWGRLERHPVEYAITCAYINRYVRPGQRVLDVGGGPGRYSLMLAALGCDVTLVDLSAANVAFALDKAAERGLPLTALAGDAREVDRLVSGEFDCVLNMGPLYHLLQEGERVRAIQACRNVLRDGGLIYAAVITSQAGILYYLENDPALILDPGEREYIQCFERDLPFSGKAFTDAHFMRPQDLCPFMETQGFDTLHRVSCEGVYSTHEAQIAAAPPEAQRRWLELSLMLCERDEYAGLAQHLLYVGKKRG